MNKKQQFAMGAVASTAALTTYTLNYETDMYKQTPTLYAATTAGCAVIVSAVSAVGYGLYQLALYGKDKMNAVRNRESTAAESREPLFSVFTKVNNTPSGSSLSSRRLYSVSNSRSASPALSVSRSASPQSFAAIQHHSRPAIQGGSLLAPQASEGRSSLDRAAKQKSPYSRPR